MATSQSIATHELGRWKVIKLAVVVVAQGYECSCGVIGCNRAEAREPLVKKPDPLVVARLREALRSLADASEAFVSSDPDMPTHHLTEAEYNAALATARDVLGEVSHG